MEKRMIIAITLSLLVLLTFQVLKPKRVNQLSPQQLSQQPVVTGEQVGLAGKEKTGRTFPEARLAEEQTTRIQTEKYDLVFSDIGGSLKKMSLREYQQGDEEEPLFDSEVPGARLFAMKNGPLADLDSRKFETTKGSNYLEYRLREPGTVEILKRYDFYNSFNYITLEIRTQNITSGRTLFSYQLVGPSGLDEGGNIAGRNFLEADIMIDGKIWKVKSVKSPQEKTGEISWSAMKNRYFTAVLKPFDRPSSAVVQALPGKNLMTALNSQRYELAPGETKVDKYLLYAGPLDDKEIAAVGYDMEQVVDYGFFGGVSKALLSVLEFFHKWTKNWGVAIICLTVLINVLLFPLTMKSFTSMHQMKKIQPHMQKLKELHKDNPQKLNKEMMELYKVYKVNPLGGCLPMLLQMPIFIALYQGLMRAVELKGANFLWIKDLAKPDAVPLPFSLPFIGSSINILPLLMAGMMVAQQKISQVGAAGSMTGDQASQQKMMMILFPLFFGFLFYKMPSGLVLYWLTNTILMTSEQALISRKRGEQ